MQQNSGCLCSDVCMVLGCLGEVYVLAALVAASVLWAVFNIKMSKPNTCRSSENFHVSSIS